MNGAVAGPKFFANASVRGILHNRFYAESVKHGKKFLPGEHQPIVGTEVFEFVHQVAPFLTENAEASRQHVSCRD